MVQIQTYLSPERPQPERVEPIKNAGRGGLKVKPRGGIWTSTLTDEESSEWLEWCKVEEFGLTDETKLWKLVPESDASVCTIDSECDLRALLEEFSRDDTLFIASDDEYLDYERIVSETEYNGIRLTKNGQRETRFSRPGLYGWDTESTIWFDWVFDEVELLHDVATHV